MNSSRFILTILILVGLATQSISAQTEMIDSIIFPIIPTEALTEALKGIKLTPEDIPFRIDNVEIDSFRLPIVDSLTEHPLEMIGFANDFSRLLFEEGEASLEKLLGFDSRAFLTGERIWRRSWPEARGVSLDYPSFSRETGCFAECINGIKNHFETIYLVTSEVRSGIDRFKMKLTAEELAFVIDTFPELLLEDIEDEFRPVDELDSLQKYEEELSKRFMPIALKLVGDSGDASEIRSLSYDYVLTMHETSLKMIEFIRRACKCDGTEFQYEVQSPVGTIAIGGYGRNDYYGSYAFILDLGGNDRYELESIESPQYIYDVDGNDQYSALTDFALASGFFYPACLRDMDGDDLYTGRNFSLGSGLFSIGVLVDEAGNDIYKGDTHVQGAGTFGIGMLYDNSGADNYHCALFGQAFAFVKGLGILCDINGNDSYFAGGKYKDVLRYKDHYLSLSQGFAYGLRPRMSGGVAILADSAGHDTYISDIFGQGSSYWYAIGIQSDFEGNDKYLSFQYAQGAGTHLTLGILLDKKGDDYYFSKGVSQGCGHDLAAGILIDYFGNDTYQAYDLSQGAGSANGFGLLVDYRGNDSYQIKGKHNTQGYGNPRRDYGSIGLFMDLAGRDEYIGNGRDESYWIIDSKWGIGMDVDFWPTDSIR
ncbi:MAG: hypothetical protein ABIK83_11805 [Candidatus Zixiibacteriota bacterium]